MPAKTLGELAEHVGGKVCGDAGIIIKSASTLKQAGPGDISFLSNHKYVNLLQTTKAGAVVVGKETEASAALLIADDPYYAFRQIVVLLYGHREHKKAGISSKASIAKTAVLGKDCHIDDFVTVSDNVKIGDRCVFYPGVFVGSETEIGDDCILYSNVVVYDNCRLGNKVIIQANATIGEDGYGFATHEGEHHKIPHIGTTIIEDDVEIGAGCGIERGTLDETIIGKGSKLGDLVAIGHGTKVGPYSLLVAQVGIAGSTTLGHHCVVGGQAGIVGHINIGNMVKIGAQSGVINDVPDGKVIFGAPAIDANKAKRAYSLIESLPQIRQSIRRLEKRLEELEKSD
ncbi:MAG: UDP-3-O-(3-hydroxymyristoyl)glucosamine N-acyltransferase [Planctomycetota bacterium]|jgi:UDP-3-O-[3-hydroxymyristoyl] glucosamine N-acyltransferase